MDFNDISARIKKTMSSMKARFSDDIEVYTTVSETIEKHKYGDKWSLKVEYQFGNSDKEELINCIFTILYNIASLKDHLKNHFRDRGLRPELVEDKINQTIELQILIDLVNQEKHGYPLRNKRSGKDPLIVNIRKSMAITAISTPQNPQTSTRVFLTQKGVVSDNPNSMKMVINAEIVDGERNNLFTLDNLVEVSFNEFDTIARTYLPDLFA